MTFCIVTGVSVEGVDDSFISLRLTVPEGGMYRVSCSAMCNSNITELLLVATRSNSLVVKDFRNDCDTIISVQIPFNTTEAGNGSGEIGE